MARAQFTFELFGLACPSDQLGDLAGIAITVVGIYDGPIGNLTVNGQLSADISRARL